MPLNPNPTVVNKSRRVILLNDPYVNPLNNLFWTTGQDNRGFQYQIALDVLPPGVTLDMIKQNQAWFVDNSTTAFRLISYVGEISVSTIQGVTISGIPTAGQALVATSTSGATWSTISGGATVSGNYLPISGGTITGDLVVSSGLTANGSFTVSSGIISTVSNSVGFGNSALSNNTTGYLNTAIGSYVLSRNTTGFFNTGTGTAALYFNTTGYSNTATGNSALQNNTTGDCNTADGYYALLANTTGTYNTAIGNGALQSNTTGNNNTAIGSNANNGQPNLNGTVAIGVDSTGISCTVNADNDFVLGTTNHNVQVPGMFFPPQYSSAPTYAKGAIYFDTTLNKLRVGGATNWETITSI